MRWIKSLYFWIVIAFISCSTLGEPFVKGDMLQILFLTIFFGIALLAIGESRAKIVTELWIE
ncbi:MAG TPA: hypothetical protein VHZ76_05915 [Gammaproteobacteria bacterium]|jgi:Na+/H+-dicarboxylate symporter|nr:hypothetical protein [Gammaproteobacteria bacterium]